MKRGLLLPCLVLASLLAACISSPDESNRESLQVSLDDALAELGKSPSFQPLLPAYLPQGTPREVVVTQVEDDELAFYIPPSEDLMIPLAQRARIGFRQRASLPLETLNPAIPTPAISNAELVMLNGTEVAVRRESGKPDYASIGFFTRKGGVDFDVEMTWLNPKDEGIVTLTDEMEEEGWAVLRSMLE